MVRLPGLTAGLVVVALIAVAGPATASADTGRTATPGVWQNGWCRGCNSGSAWSSAYSTILEGSPFVYDDPNATNLDNYSDSYVEMDDSQGSAWTSYGPGKVNDKTRYDIFECAGPGFGDVVVTEPAQTSGTSHTFKVKNVSGGKEIYLDGTFINSCSATFTPSAVFVQNQVLNQADQISGTTGSHQTFTSSKADISGTVYDILGAGGFDGVKTVNGNVESGAASWDNASKDSSAEMEGWDGCC